MYLLKIDIECQLVIPTNSISTCTYANVSYLKIKVDANTENQNYYIYLDCFVCRA